MKSNIKILALLLALVMLLASCGTGECAHKDSDKNKICDLCGVKLTTDESCEHEDDDSNGICDKCASSVYVTIDFYSINDLHGKFNDADTNVGVDELTTYLKERNEIDDHTVLLSGGDMWQGGPESNLTKGKIVTEWMNHLGFEAMTLGNHEFDWGEDFIKENGELADFPLLAINIYSQATEKRVDYAKASTVIERGGIKIGIIGAIGDCYSSIAGDKSKDFYIKTGTALTNLVKEEATSLRKEGVDLIVYVIHDGYNRNSNTTQSIGSSQLDGYYDTALSNGYVDLVFEGHTHKNYVLRDEFGVYHLQNGGDNRGISHAEITVNSVTGTKHTNEAKFISTSKYDSLKDDPIVKELLEKYKDAIAKADEVLGTNSSSLASDEISSLVVKLYYERAIKEWGDIYDIVLGGGQINVRSPYKLPAGEVKYSQLQSLLTFDNNIVLCSIQGSDLQSRFFYNDGYNVYCESYGEEVRDSIDPTATYYIVTDTWSSSYAPNRLTEIDRIDGDFFARDLLAEYIKAGGLEK